VGPGAIPVLGINGLHSPPEILNLTPGSLPGLQPFSEISRWGGASLAGAKPQGTSMKFRMSTKPKKLQFRRNYIFFCGFSNTGIMKNFFLQAKAPLKMKIKGQCPYQFGYFFLNWGMRSLTSFPTISTRCSSSALVSALKTGRLTRFSSIHSRANSPSWISRRISCMAT
jgi:hypothetical protein